MLKRDLIIDAISRRVAEGWHADIRQWRIGVTQSLRSCYETCGKPRSFWSWPAASLGEAQAVRGHFVIKGMQCDPDGKMDLQRETYVYIC